MARRHGPVSAAPAPGGGTVRSARLADLDPHTLHALLRLRVDVFVVEQRCPYPDLDGRDTEPGTWHVWLERDGLVVGCLRVLEEPGGGGRIGRVAVAPPARRAGAGRALLEHGLALSRRPVHADVQSHLASWYGRCGFEVVGEEFIEDGIPHVPMRLP